MVVTATIPSRAALAVMPLTVARGATRSAIRVQSEALMLSSSVVRRPAGTLRTTSLAIFKASLAQVSMTPLLGTPIITHYRVEMGPTLSGAALAVIPWMAVGVVMILSIILVPTRALRLISAMALLPVGMHRTTYCPVSKTLLVRVMMTKLPVTVT